MKLKQILHENLDEKIRWLNIVKNIAKMIFGVNNVGDNSAGPAVNNRWRVSIELKKTAVSSELIQKFIQGLKRAGISADGNYSGYDLDTKTYDLTVFVRGFPEVTDEETLKIHKDLGHSIANDMYVDNIEIKIRDKEANRRRKTFKIVKKD